MNSKFATSPIRNQRLYWLALTGAMSLFATTTAHAEVTERFDFQPGQILNLDFPEGGSIQISGWDQPGIEVRYDDDHGLDRHDVQFQSSAEGLNVTARLLDGYNTSGLRFYFNAPRELMVELESGGGSIELDGLIGDFIGTTGGGAIILKDLEGNVNLRTGGGRILVQDSVVDGRVGTGGGKVLVENVTGAFHATSGGGEVKYRNVSSSNGRVVSPNKSKLEGATSESILISNAGGSIKLDAAPEGADVYTGGGKIRVKNANHFVAAKTGGGDIEIDLNEGWVNASTGAGDVDINVAKNSSGLGNIEVDSGYGDITLTVPSDFSMDLVVELGVTNNTNKNYSVRSDFDIETSTDDQWDYSHGTPRKFTHGTALINGGNHQVTIRATNGNVEIKKGR